MMHSFAPKSEKRRQFLRAVVRAGLLLLLLAAGRLAGRPGALSGQRCVGRGFCAGCPVFSFCGRPRAVAARTGGDGG
jgi:hypothetical protein